MTKWIENWTGIRNFGVKTVLAIVGLYFVIGTGHKYVADLCNELKWDSSDTYIMLGGFFLAVGAAVYNVVLDAIIEKFKK
ncbi:hypothetical protein [Flagellimonas sp. CMM7]|uniref:hypothetical protein n=1 Tax=Flagellimonas sp. CMM7 TaxID=2654676 RepID=UPI0013D30A20|nr:hypothetical protein [Flagellimonas sp. CMM7]UII79992.1 hypothetical protein LV704_00375 [Flagellimonas sp. CMM7]